MASHFRSYSDPDGLSTADMPCFHGPNRVSGNALILKLLQYKAVKPARGVSVGKGCRSSVHEA